MFVRNEIFQIESTDGLPIIVCSKDVNGEYMEGNERQAMVVGLSNVHDLKGKTDFDFVDSQSAGLLQQNDSRVWQSHKSYCFIESYISTKTLHAGTYLSIKHPRYDRDSKIIGIFGFSIELTASSFINAFMAIAKNTDMMIPSQKILELHQSYLTTKSRDFKLTQRETECLCYLVRGKTAKSIAQLLKLSPRTVEYYLDNIKNKLGCRTKSQLIEWAIEKGL